MVVFPPFNGNSPPPSIDMPFEHISHYAPERFFGPIHYLCRCTHCVAYYPTEPASIPAHWITNSPMPTGTAVLVLPRMMRDPSTMRNPACVNLYLGRAHVRGCGCADGHIFCHVVHNPSIDAHFWSYLWYCGGWLNVHPPTMDPPHLRPTSSSILSIG